MGERYEVVDVLSSFLFLWPTAIALATSPLFFLLLNSHDFFSEWKRHNEQEMRVNMLFEGAFFLHYSVL